jgi:membrane protein
MEPGLAAESAHRLAERVRTMTYVLAAGFALGCAVATAGLSALRPSPAQIPRTSPAKPGRKDAGKAAPVRPGWWPVLSSTVRKFNEDRIPATAAGMTFFFLLAAFPALSAVVSLYGLAADAADVQKQIGYLEGVAPPQALHVLTQFLEPLARAGSSGLSLAFAVSLAVSIWSANSGMKAMISALNIAYEVREQRGLVRLNLVSLAFTAGGMLLAVLTLAAVVSAPQVLAALQLRPVADLAWLRWPILLGLVIGPLALLYRFAPERGQAHWRSIVPGAVVAGLAWIAMSALFSWYVANFGHYDRTYGSLGAIVAALTWVWFSLLVVLFGAELNAALERR